MISCMCEAAVIKLVPQLPVSGCVPLDACYG